MNGQDLQQLETIVRGANPVPQPSTLIDSEEAVAVTRLLSRARGMDVPGLLPAVPASHLRELHAEDALERGHDMDTQERTHLQDLQRPRATEQPRRWRTLAIGFAAVIVIGALAGVGLIIFGGDESPVPPTDLGPDITFVDPDGKLAAHTAAITDLIEDTYTRAATLLDVDGVRLTVSPDIPRGVAPDYGVGYQFADVDSVVIAIDPWLPELGSVLPEQVPTMVAMALYDAARWRALGDQETWTLLDDLVATGLSAHFAEELVGPPLPPWFDAFPATQNQEVMDRAIPELDTSDFDVDDWFFGGKTEIPVWAGFTLAYRMIETYQADNPGLAAADLVSTPAFVFRPVDSPVGG
jgi:uncharacterized protein YjaZ